MNWKPIKDYIGYEVSSCGNVRSVDRIVNRKDGKTSKQKGRKLKGTINRYGYIVVKLYSDGVGTSYSVHRLVGLAFIDNKLNKPCINHIDGDKTNNNINNLEWCTYSENSIHAHKNGLASGMKGETNHNSKLTIEQVKTIRTLYNSNKNNTGSYHNKPYSQRKLSKMFGVHQALIHRIVNNKIWKIPNEGEEND